MRSLTSAIGYYGYFTIKHFRVIFQFNDKRRIIQDLYFSGKISIIRELKGIAFLNFNAEIAIKIRTNSAVGTFDLNDRKNQRLFVYCVNYLTSYLKLFSIYTTHEQ